MDRDLLAKMYSAVLKCMSISEKITKIDDVKNSIVYDIVLSNLILIRDIENKLSETTKKVLDYIDWRMFDEYEKQFNNKLEFNDTNIIFDILKNELPKLQINLENVIFSQ